MFLLALMVVFTVMKPSFIDPINVFNIMRQISITGLIALGMTFVILTAGIDLSRRLAAGLLRHDRRRRRQGRHRQHAVARRPPPPRAIGWFAALLAAVVVGAPAGGIQGLAITRLKVPPFVVTLGGLTIFRGLTLTISNGGPISGFDASMRWFGTGLVGPVPVPVDHLRHRRHPLPHRAALHPLWPRGLCRRRQRRSRAAVRPARRPHPDLGLCHRRLLLRPCRLRAVGAPQFLRSRGRHRL